MHVFIDLLVGCCPIVHTSLLGILSVFLAGTQCWKVYFYVIFRSILLASPIDVLIISKSTYTFPSISKPKENLSGWKWAAVSVEGKTVGEAVLVGLFFWRLTLNSWTFQTFLVMYIVQHICPASFLVWLCEAWKFCQALLQISITQSFVSRVRK